MNNSSHSAILHDEIQNLEIRLAYEEQLLKDEFFNTYERLKPVNLLKSTIRTLFTSPRLTDDIIGTAVGLTTGYLSKKIVIGTSGNVIRKLLGLLLQVGVTSAVSKHPEEIKSLGHYIYVHFLTRKSK